MSDYEEGRYAASAGGGRWSTGSVEEESLRRVICLLLCRLMSFSKDEMKPDELLERRGDPSQF